MPDYLIIETLAGRKPIDCPQHWVTAADPAEAALVARVSGPVIVLDVTSAPRVGVTQTRTFQADDGVKVVSKTDAEIHALLAAQDADREQAKLDAVAEAEVGGPPPTG